MRLLNVKTFEFEEFIGKVGNGIPLYAILSHTWDIEEVSFEDYVGQQCKSKKGYNKIYNCCRVAESEGFQYVWIDTCCIDKSSSAELSEAINSMFQWYREAALCYVYLSDVDSSEDPTTGRSSFFRSRWFTRGWTLQELLAPAEVVFLSSDWVEIGSKKSLLSTVSRIAGIDEKALDEYRGTEYSVAQKMSWAAARQTTRIEDEAYCLMGLFEINMPLLYGEGDKAFSRLQQEILKQSEDQSIFAWSYPEEYHSHTSMTGLLAPSPKCFKDISRVELLEYKHGEEYDNAFEVVGRRIRIRSRILDQVKAINLGKLNRDSILRVIEVQQSGERREVESLASSTASNLEIDVTPNIEEAIISMPIPVIVIEGEDKALDSSSGSLSESVLQEDAFQKEITDRSSVESTTQVLCTNRIEHFASENTYWYIYEPVIIVPLRCHVRNEQLSILLTKGSVNGIGRNTLWRLHNPSLIALKEMRQSQPSPLATMYASVSGTPVADPNSISTLRRFDSIDIRISPLLSAGYTAHEDSGRGWSLDSLGGTVLQGREYPLFILFHHATGDDKSYPPFFLHIPGFIKRTMLCEIGILRREKGSDYEVYAFDLAKDRYAEAELGNGQAVTVKLREGNHASFLSASMGTWSGNSRPSKVTRYDAAKALYSGFGINVSVFY